MMLNYKLTNSVTLHSEQNPGVTCVAIDAGFDDLLLTGGKDGSIVIFNRAQDKVRMYNFDFFSHFKPGIEHI